ncbi:MAG: hypothetical protein OEW00_08740 [candidate division Zixibacteria bacterium]|nr:hypothetical protein [candidate division Zixibacteria bacterium]
MDEYGKDPSRFISEIKTWPEYDTFYTDVVIMPGDTFSPDIDTIARTMSTQLFEAYRDSLHKLVLYPYTFIEYRDYRNQVFNAIRIEHIILNVDTADGACDVEFVKKADELYRWDVPD